MIEYVRVKLYADCKFRRVSGTGTSPNLSSEYTEEGLHKPYFDSSSVWTVDSGSLLYNSGSAKLSPKKGHEFDEIEIPVDYNEFNGITSAKRTPRFIGLEVDLTSGISFTIPGWIDSIEPVAVKGPSSNCRIKWHVDYWLLEEMYKNYAAKYPSLTPRIPFSFGQGRIKRGPASFARPDPSVPRFWKKGSTNIRICDQNSSINKEAWIVIAYTKTTGTAPNVYTQLQYAYWQIYETITSAGDTYQTCNWYDIFGGKIEELLGLNPESIIGCWASPIRPFAVSSTPTIIQVGNYAAHVAYYVSHNNIDIPMGSVVKTDDSHKIVFYDVTGTEIFTAPWGLEFDNVEVQIDIGTSGANMQCYLKLTGESNTAYEGRLFEFPLPTLPITENSWSSYNFSGEREYDIISRDIQREQSLKSGVAGSGESAIGGLIGGAMVGGPIGAIAGAVGGWALSTVGSFVQEGIQAKADRKSQEAVDKLKSSQTAGLILTARGYNGFYTIGKENGWRIVTMERDAVSSAELTAEQSELGYITDTYAADCSTIISEGGGLRIEGLEIKGDVPREGREYISALFARGVHLDLIN